MAAQPVPYEAVPSALLALDLLARQRRPKLEGTLCVGAVGHDLKIAWWCARFSPYLDTAFLDERPEVATATLLLGGSEAEALAARGTLADASLVIAEGDVALMKRFFTAIGGPA